MVNHINIILHTDIRHTSQKKVHSYVYPYEHHGIQ